MEGAGRVLEEDPSGRAFWNGHTAGLDQDRVHRGSSERAAMVGVGLDETLEHPVEAV
jgi:hypothetical protein